jgi:hypothetical protein
MSVTGIKAVEIEERSEQPLIAIRRLGAPDERCSCST